MKVLAITAGRINGNTQKAASALINELAALAKAEGSEAVTDMIALSETELGLCRGCRACMEKGEQLCPCKDSGQDIARKMREADAVILASPVYVEGVSGSMKNLIDRMAYNCYRQALAGKTAYVVTTSGIGSTAHALRTMTAALLLWGLSVAGTLKLITGGGRMSEDELKSRYGKAIKRAARQMYAGIKRAPRPSIRSLIVFKVQQISWQKTKEQSITRDYWEKQGWLKSRCTYYMPHSRSRALTAAMRVVGRAVALFFV